MKEDYPLLKAKFLKAFANLPEKVKSDEVVAVVDDRPYTWTAAVVEVKNETPTGHKILKILNELKIL